MKGKIFNFLLILTSLTGYLEWGKDSHQFLFLVEKELILKLFYEPAFIMHPFTIFPFAAQILLLITLFQRTPNKILTYAGIGGIGVLIVLMFMIGLISMKFKILLSTVPFLVIAILTIKLHSEK